MPTLNPNGLAPFKTPRWLAHPWAQTIYPMLFPLYLRAPSGEQRLIETSEGDKIAVAFDHTDHAANGRGVILVHGLCGSQDSRYIVRISKLLGEHGYLVARMNMRGCGPGLAHAQRPFHSGRSEDLAALVDALPHLYPKVCWLIAGFSLGANVALKYLGEVGSTAIEHLAHCLAVSPPIELAQSAAKIDRRENFVVQRYFVSKLIAHAHLLAKVHGQPPPDLSQVKTLRDFDARYTAPRANFASVDAYYHGASAARVLDRISGRCTLLFSHDDPVIDTHAVAALDLPNLTIDATEQGGHVAFIGQRERGHASTVWLDRYVLALANRTLRGPAR
jgi:predicted alpha/beta-fold hydrolase